MKHPRLAVGALAVSASMFLGLIAEEGWFDVATIPTQGDVPTVGPGLTKRPDGSPVQLGDKVTPQQGLARSLDHIRKDETRLRLCVTAPLNQTEYDVLVNHAYQYGVEATCSSGMVQHANAGRYADACAAYLSYRYMTSGKPLGPGWVAFKYDAAGAPVRWRFDCSTPGNRVCAGVWSRSLARANQCRSAL